VPVAKAKGCTELEAELKELLAENGAIEMNIKALDKQHTYDQCKIYHNRGQKVQL
jgi:hypothetical protein